HSALAIPLHARDLGAAEAPRTVDADAARAQSHRRLHGTLHGAAKGNPALELLCNRFGDELSIELRLANLNDVDNDVRLRKLGDFFAQLLDVRALLADDDARARRLNGDPALLVRPLDHDLRHRGLLKILHQLLADLHILMQQLAVLVLARVPARVPGTVDAEPQADRIDLLTHRSHSSRSRRFDLTHYDGQVGERLENSSDAAAAARGEALDHDRLADMGLDDHEIVDVEIMVVLRIGDRRLQALAHVTRDPLAREFEIGERHRHLLAADQLRDKVELLRAHPQHAGDRLGFVVGEAPWALLLAHRISPQL